MLFVGVSIVACRFVVCSLSLVCCLLCDVGTWPLLFAVCSCCCGC